MVHLGMFAVCLILALSIARPNPFSFGGAQNARFDPARPGIVRWVRHPILLSLALWAGLHLLPNGDLSHVILFGVLGALPLPDVRSSIGASKGKWAVRRGKHYGPACQTRHWVTRPAHGPAWQHVLA